MGVIKNAFQHTLLGAAIVAAAGTARADDCAVVSRVASNWEEIGPRNYTTLDLTALHTRNRLGYRLATPSLLYRPARTVGDWPRPILIPAELNTYEPVQLRSNRDEPILVNVKVILSDSPRVVIKEVATGALWDSFTATDTCESNDVINGVSTRKSLRYRVKLNYLRTPD